MAIKTTVVLMTMVLGTSCAAVIDGPPEIVVDRTACSHCGMLISEPLYAAASQAPGEAPRVFDDIGCLRNAARSEPEGLHIWVHDAADGEWIDGDSARFVSSTEIRTPMGGGILAYRRSADAEQSAQKHHGQSFASWPALLEQGAKP